MTAVPSTWAILLMLALTDPSGPIEFLNFLDPDAYFQSRQIELQPEKLIEIAVHAPRSSKDSIRQLLAIRWLDENLPRLSAMQKANARAAFEQLAAKGLGFARDHAQQSLARLEKMPSRRVRLPKEGLQDGLASFPEDVTLFGALDLRLVKELKPGSDIQRTEGLAKTNVMSLFRQMPPQARESVFRFAETVGNLRIDRVAFALNATIPAEGQSGMTFRITGQGNRRWLIDAFRQTLRAHTIEEKDAGIAVIALKDQNTAFAFVGDTDLLICVGSKSLEDINSALAVRDGRKPSIVKNAAAGLEGIPAKARGIMMGTLPEHLRHLLVASSLGAAPQRMVLSLVDTPDAPKICLRFQGKMQNAEEVKTFVEGAEGLKKQGLDALGRVPVAFLKPTSLQVLMETLSGVTIRVDGTSVNGNVILSPELGAVISEIAALRIGMPVTAPNRK